MQALESGENWASSSEAIAQRLNTSFSKGLSSEEARRRLAQHGYNQLPEAKSRSVFAIFLSQFQNFLIGVLFLAAAIAGILGEWLDAIVIGVIILLNGILGFVQEYHAERSLAALKNLASPVSKVFRDGFIHSIPSLEIVPGDLILLESGDRVPADGRITEAYQFKTLEAALTGESLPVHKTSEPILKEKVPMAERNNMVFMGTVAVYGKAKMLALETGIHTELGKIAGLLVREPETQTPLQGQLEKLGRWLVGIFGIIVGIVFITGLLRGNPWVEMLLTAMSLAVAAIPEGLPAVVTIALALGVQRMSKRNALIRKLPSVETLGCATVICTDKTGTLTKNEMTVRWIWFNERFIQVTGNGYEPRGEFLEKEKTITVSESPELRQVLTLGMLCNNAELLFADGQWAVAGDPTEGALLVAAQKAGLQKSHLEEQYPFLGELPFESGRKRMSVLRKSDAREVLYVKGAPDIILKHSNYFFSEGGTKELSDAIREKIKAANHHLAGQALRVLAVAYREFPQGTKLEESLEQDLVFMGLTAMMDPPRTEVKEAIRICKQAGIRPVMITGDHRQTAAAIARELGMLEEHFSVVDGAELDLLSEKQLEEKIRSIAVYARVSAEHKLKIVRAWKNAGEVVAMTGDGVNDAPAIKEAHIGVAMGISGTDVTKEASDMIVTDDNFASIVSAVEEGRGIYDNILKFVNYLLSSNLAEILVLFLGTLSGWKTSDGALILPLSAIQLLWMNLITDGLPAVALGVDPVDPQAMKKRPRDPRKPMLSGPFLGQIAGVSFLIAAGALAACIWGARESLARAQSMTLTTLISLQFVRVQMVRSEYHIRFFSNIWLISALCLSFLLQLLILYAPACQTVFGTVPLGLRDWFVIGGIVASLWMSGKFTRFLYGKR